MPGYALTSSRSSNSFTNTAIIVLAALAMMAPWLPDKVPYGHSIYFNRVWMASFPAQFVDGHLYPRWLETLWNGAGGADFYFYAPLPYWLGGVIRALCPSCSPDDLIVLSSVFWLALSGVAFNALASRFLDRGPALCGTVLFMALPYHLATDWADRQALGEFAAIAFVPFHFAAAVDCLENRRHAVLKLSVWTALILLSHLPSALIVGIGYFPFIAAFRRSVDLSAIARLAAAAVLGTALSAIYWFPALQMMDSANVQVLSQEIVNWRHHFLFNNFAVDQDTAVLVSRTITYALFTALAVATLLAIRPPWPPALSFALATLAMVWFLVTPVSAPLWASTPVSAVQFPWRFLILSDLAIAMIAAHCFQRAGTATGRTRTLVTILCGAFVLVTAMEHPSFRGERRFVGNVELPVRLSAGAREWLPKEIDAPESLNLDIKAHLLAQSLPSTPPVSAVHEQDIRLRRISPTEARLEGTLTEPDVVTIKRTYWRYWHLVDRESGAEIALRPTTRFPLIQADLPAGRVDYLLTLREPRAVRVGQAISLVALMAALALALGPSVRGALRRSPPGGSGAI